MKKFVKKILALGLTGMIFIPTACGGGEGTVSQKEWHEDNVSQIELFCNDWEQFNNAKAVNSPIYQELVKATGCQIKAKSTALETYYTTLDLQRNKKSLCEMFIVDGPTDPEFFNGLIRGGEILAISDYVNESTKDRYPYLYEFLQQYDYMKSNISYAKGKLWFIPNKWQNEKSLYVRRDWVKNLNAKLDQILVSEGVVTSASAVTNELRTKYQFNEEGPETISEFYRLARAFTLYDPDNNGKNDTYGYVTEENRDMDSWLHVAFDGAWKMWVDTNGDGTYEDTNTSTSAMLATSLLNKMVSEGYASREVVQKTVGQKQEDFTNGKAGMMYAHNWYNVIVASMMTASGGTIETVTNKIAITNPPAGANGKYGGQGDVEYYRGWCLRSGMSVERREVCLKLMEYLHSPEGIELVTYGKYGEHWEWENDEEGGNKVSIVEKDAQGFVQALRWSDPAAFAVYLTYEPSEASALLTNGDIITKANQNSAASMVVSDYPDLYTNSMIKYRALAEDYFDTTVLNIIIDSSLEATWEYDAKTWLEDGMTKLYTVSSAMQSAWDDYVSKYNSSYRGSQMAEEYNAAIRDGDVVKVTK